MVVALVPHVVVPGRQYHYERHQCVALVQVMAWLLVALLPAAEHQAYKQEEGLDDLLVYFHPLESAGNFAGV